MENLTKDILEVLNNKHTKVELKEDFKGNYYSYLIDTIYIAKDFKKLKAPDGTKKINKKAAELVTICHECTHSIQNKYMHILNITFSNLGLVLALITITLGLFWTSILWLKIVAASVILASIIIRLIMEVGAIDGSIKLASTLLSENVEKDISKQDIEESRRYINKYKYVALLQMIIDKILFLILVIVI